MLATATLSTRSSGFLLKTKWACFRNASITRFGAPLALSIAITSSPRNNCSAIVPFLLRAALGRRVTGLIVVAALDGGAKRSDQSPTLGIALSAPATTEVARPRHAERTRDRTSVRDHRVISGNARDRSNVPA